VEAYAALLRAIMVSTFWASRHKITEMNKVIKVIAGPNGSGKTTFAEAFVVKSKPALPFLNPDLIAAGFGPLKDDGHNITTSTVRRRQLRCFENFWTIYLPIANSWTILDNSGSRPKIISSSVAFEKMKSSDKQDFEIAVRKGFL
jgi:predicted ABC-type ATPase